MIWHCCLGKTQMVRHQAHRFRKRLEYIIWGVKGKKSPERNVPFLLRVYTIPIFPKEKQHISAKPIELMPKIVEICEPHGLIVDPFCGSGARLVVAKKADYYYIGYDLLAHNVKISGDRRLTKNKYIQIEPS